MAAAIWQAHNGRAASARPMAAPQKEAAMHQLRRVNQGTARWKTGK
jgi:hypothetical protein